ncbi:MAG TPA: hypothetical protein VJK52_05470 [Candidatus Nanoarchaeia archaeon]|nr:hypothetical protein [Candidatus Nanoarchaeia archaeon]
MGRSTGYVGLVALVGALAAPVYAAEPAPSKPVQVAKAIVVPVSYEQAHNRREPDARLHALIDDYQTIEDMTKAGLYNQVLTRFTITPEEAERYDLEVLPKGERNQLAEALSDLGTCFYEKGNLERSIDFSRVAVRLNSDNQSLQRNLALSKKELGKKLKNREILENAIAEYERVQQINPQSTYAHEATQAIRTIRDKYLPSAN